MPEIMSPASPKLNGPISPTLKALTAYRDRLKKQGRLLEARAVDYCISLVKKS